MKRVLSILEGEISHFQALGNILVCGEELDTINSHRDKDLPGSNSLSLPTYPPETTMTK
jgi:hypothetical protein